jgi:hypothetical protein
MIFDSQIGHLSLLHFAMDFENALAYTTAAKNNHLQECG